MSKLNGNVPKDIKVNQVATLPQLLEAKNDGDNIATRTVIIKMSCKNLYTLYTTQLLKIL